MLSFWCKSGHGEFVVDGVRHPLDPHDLYVLPWNRHITYLPSAREPRYTAHVHMVPWYRLGAPWVPNVPHEAHEAGFGSSDRGDADWPLPAGAVRLHALADERLGRLVDDTIRWYPNCFGVTWACRRGSLERNTDRSRLHRDCPVTSRLRQGHGSDSSRRRPRNPHGGGLVRSLRQYLRSGRWRRCYDTLISSPRRTCQFTVVVGLAPRIMHTPVSGLAQRSPGDGHLSPAGRRVTSPHRSSEGTNHE